MVNREYVCLCYFRGWLYVYVCRRCTAVCMYVDVCMYVCICMYAWIANLRIQQAILAPWIQHHDDNIFSNSSKFVYDRFIDGRGRAERVFKYKVCVLRCWMYAYIHTYSHIQAYIDALFHIHISLLHTFILNCNSTCIIYNIYIQSIHSLWTDVVS